MLGSQAQRHQTVYPFWLGGSASCMAACVTHPLDLIKVRLQGHQSMRPNNVFAAFNAVSQESGWRGYYRGLSAGLTRQATYSTIRFAVYEDLKSRCGPLPDWPTLVAIAAGSGFLGGLVGNFADIVNVRMQNDGALPVGQRRGYRNIFHGVGQMVRNEGFPSLLKGWLPNCTRAAVQTTGQLVTYDVLKRFLATKTSLGDGMSTQFTASFLAGLIAVTITNPIDVIKTRIMSNSGSSSVLGLVSNNFLHERFGWLFKGWLPSFIRIGPHTVSTFFFLELHRDLYRRLSSRETPC